MWCDAVMKQGDAFDLPGWKPPTAIGDWSNTGRVRTVLSKKVVCYRGHLPMYRIGNALAAFDGPGALEEPPSRGDMKFYVQHPGGVFWTRSTATMPARQLLLAVPVARLLCSHGSILRRLLKGPDRPCGAPPLTLKQQLKEAREATQEATAAKAKTEKSCRAKLQHTTRQHRDELKRRDANDAERQHANDLKFRELRRELERTGGAHRQEVREMRRERLHERAEHRVQLEAAGERAAKADAGMRAAVAARRVAQLRARTVKHELQLDVAWFGGARSAC